MLNENKNKKQDAEDCVTAHVKRGVCVCGVCLHAHMCRLMQKIRNVCKVRTMGKDGLLWAGSDGGISTFEIF